MTIDPHQEWETPSDFYSVIQAEFAPDVDVAARRSNAKCNRYITPEVDALGTISWIDSGNRTAWCNPGFKNMLPWVTKAHEQATMHGGTILVLGLVAPSTDWWQFAEKTASEIRLIGGRRIQFEPAPGVKKSSNARENALFIFRCKRAGPPAHIWTWDWTIDWERLDNATRRTDVA